LIVIPRVLSDLLRTVDGLQARMLPLAFAEHALEKCREVLTPEHLDLALRYTRSAKEFVGGTGDIAALGRARSDYFAGRDAGSSDSERVMWIAAIAVTASCQREMEDAGFVVKDRYVPDVAVVATEARKAVARCAARLNRDRDAVGESELAQRIEWEEARWQLTRVIETTPFPRDRAPSS
jgi:hypothetical protein